MQQQIQAFLPKSRAKAGMSPDGLTTLSSRAQCRPPKANGVGHAVEDRIGLLGPLPSRAERATAAGALSPVSPMAATEHRFITADVGGTNARIALVRTDAAGRIAVQTYR